MKPRGGWLDPASAAEALGIPAAELLTLAGEGQVTDAVLDRDGWRFRRSTIARLAAQRTEAIARAGAT